MSSYRDTRWPPVRWSRALPRRMESAVSDRPILLFLHGVGDGDPHGLWKTTLETTLDKLGYPDLTEIQVVAPKYAHALRGMDDAYPLPSLQIKELTREAARQNRRDFEQRMGALEFRLGRHDRGNAYPGADVALGAAVGLAPFRQARNYLESPLIRAGVLTRVLEKLPPSGRLVIVGHSLGSVIASDLLRRLPIGLEVAGMVTVGSPLANGKFDVDKLRDSLSEPPSNLSWWVNVWNVADPVAAHRGVSSVFPWMLDLSIKTKKAGAAAHAAVDYLADDLVGAAVGYALFGSQSKEIAKVEKGSRIKLDEAERLALVALRYAHLIRQELEGDVRDRYTGALRSVQASAVHDIRSRNEREGRDLPSEIARLAFDYSEPRARMPEPHAASHISKIEAIPLLVVLAGENLLRPYEVAVPRGKRQAALQQLTREMDLGSRLGEDVFEASKRAHEVLSGGDVNWLKWGALGAGAAAIIVATGGLVLAAAPGLVGAAVITSALASFGPGGMIGGLLTAGTLVTAGGGGIAFGLASSATNAQTLEAVVERRLTAAILRDLQGQRSDPEVWKVLTAIEIELRREYEKLDEFSDPSSSSLKELKRKIQVVERALKYLSDHDLDPSLEGEGEGEESS